MPRKGGPKPTPTHILRLKGNPGKRPLNELEPKPLAGFPPAPEYLDEQGRQAYERFGGELATCGVGTKLDGTALELLANAYAEYVSAESSVLKYGYIWMQGNKSPGEIPTYVYSPYWVARNNAEKRLRVLLTEFGMTPSSRAKIVMDAPVKEENGWEGLLA